MIHTSEPEGYSPERRTALVLSGTGADGAYHAGVLRALHETGIKVDLIGGRGVGALGAVLHAIDGAARLWEPGGVWRAHGASAIYRWRWPFRWLHGLVLALLGVLAIPLVILLGIAAMYPVAMEDELALARTAAVKFLNLLPTAEDITLVDFDTEVRVTRYPQRDFPRIVERIRGRKAGGETAFYDALGVYLDGASGITGRPVLVIYSDGIDSRSSISFKEVVDLLKASNATVYAIGLLDHAGSARLDARMKLQALTEVTGGTAMFPASARDLDGFYAQVLREIRAQYQLGYSSTNTAPDGRWRAVEVKVKRPGLKVRTRKGYFARYSAAPAPRP